MDEEELTEQIIENIIGIIEDCSYINDYGDEMAYISPIIEAIRGWYGL